jgi:predicted GNAT family N-acyltransferase
MIKLKDLILENENDDFIINSKPDSVSVSLKSSYGPGSRPSIASIDNIGNGTWWISRVLIGNREQRGQGIGSKLLQKAVEEVLKHEPTAKIIVEPGGYGGNTEDQIRFYKNNGFIDLPGEPGSLIYGGNQ